MRTRKIVLTAALIAAAVLGAADDAGAQVYPARPITLVVPYPAGGGTDVLARVVAKRMEASVGRPIIVENVGGANGSIGVGRVARATPDGYTLCLGNSATHVLNGAVYPLQYDVVKSFAPIALLTSDPLILITARTVPANTLAELIVWLKANPDKATQATLGSGSLAHIAGIALQKQTGVRFGFVPYRGNAPALQDLVAGRVDLMLATADSLLPQVRSGSIKAYAVTAATRLAAAPDIPTADEAGVPGLRFALWNALFAPAGTSAAVVAKLNAAAVESLADASVHVRLNDFGFEIAAPERQTPEALGALQKAEIDKWWPIIAAAGIRVE
jgi:tripartite-type tricarboxylate transporter receptor subunit TctC